ncbi:MAG: precorrin-3B synthase [Pseudodonghicola sp.]
MSDPIVRGWCPGALRPMLSGDGLVVRIRPPLGRLRAEQAVGVALLARQHGNGLIDLSSRANLQLRGIAAENHPALIAGLRALDLVDATAGAEARRNIVLTPFWQTGDDSARIAAALAAALTAPDAPALPGKFGFAVDCGAAPVLTGTPADIRLERDTTNGLICRADGAAAGARVTVETATDTALTLARWFLESGGAPEGRGRMARHLASGVTLPPAFTQCPAAAGTTPPAPGPCAQGVLAALEFGQIDAETLATLAELGPLRLTPWRMLLIEGAARAAALPGLIADPADPRLRVVACTGAPACPQALSATRPLARALASALPPALPQDARLHVSGCTKGCAHPGPAPFTLVATGPDRFDLIRRGRASDPPDRSDLTADALTAHPDLLTEGP